MLDRRSLLIGGLASATFSTASARDWEGAFDTASARLDGLQDVETPLLSATTLHATRIASETYTGWAAEGGWPAYPFTQRLSLGAQGNDASWLRQRLAVTGDLASQYGAGTVVDSFVDAAIRRFQARHGLTVDGVAGAATFEALNRPAADRARSLTANIPRLQAALVDDRRQVTVNVPSAQIEMVEDGAVVLRQSAVVGQPNRATPLLSSKIHEINFNPYWHVPKSIIRRDLIPIIRRDPDYLTRMGMRIYTGNWKEVSPSSIDWSTDEATNYVFRQEPGSRNALGRVRINFANQHSVYLHDTPDPGLFGDASRFHSSGCVRVQRIPEFVTWLLKDTPGWSTEAVAEFLTNGQRRDVAITNPVPVHFVYITAWGVPAGPAQFRKDIYSLVDGS
ncbi:L,D-transpeptidase family protein [Brucella pseudogrignonensis]|uniref:L,D-transpeptidase family protein n=1 Tax=Brucella pseudogrignonensis TaxID=419475 RepID=UPI00124C44DC|nr:L,D-transpeptidase family protein [Brucella pseudogrignonensis]KAB2688778.1 L,D-transpeptidase family protein [Brucella pseudogrignonensis]